MSEQLQTQVEPISHFALDEESLIESFIDRGVISQELVESGALDCFEEGQFLHFIVGDDDGGLHHLPSFMESGVYDIDVGSKIEVVDDNDGNAAIKARYRKEQTVKENGTFRMKSIEVTHEDGEKEKKDFGTVMFPNEWSTEDVVGALAETSKTTPESVDPSRGSALHTKEVNGVTVAVITDADSGKIITGYPKE